MAKKVFKIEYEFTSTRADGDAYTRTREVEAHSRDSALMVAKIVGFQEFGKRFNDNCTDWWIVD